VNPENKISRAHYIVLGVSGLFLFFLIWSLLSYTGVVAPLFLPTPTSVASAIGALLVAGRLLPDIFASLNRILLSFLLSLVVAVPLGIALGVSKRFEAFTEPLIAFIRYIPPSAFIPLAIIWFGIGESEKIVILFLGVAPYLALLIADVVINTRRELIDVALTLGATQKNIITKVIFPNAMPGIWDSFRIMMGAAWTYVIIAEIVGASSGLGYLMTISQRFLRTDDIFAVIVIIGFLGLATDYFFKITYKIFFPWTEKSSHA
jgi:NitT/TauT family transport system permease protein